MWLDLSPPRVHNRHQALLTPQENSLPWVLIICPSLGAVFACQGTLHTAFVSYPHTGKWQENWWTSVFESLIKKTTHISLSQVHHSSSLPPPPAPQPHKSQLHWLSADPDWCPEQHKLGCITQQGFADLQGHHIGPELCSSVWPGSYKCRATGYLSLSLTLDPTSFFFLFTSAFND